MSTITEHIGSRIRLYRRLQGLTIDQLAAMIGKSKSTISKYETGSVSIDVDTLFSIAAALNAPITQFTDCYAPSHDTASAPKGFFGSPGNYYMYHLSRHGKLLRSVIRMHFPAEGADDFSAEFYNGVTDYDRLHRCNFYYTGSVSFSDLYTNMVFSNQINVAEKVFIIAGNPLDNSDMTMGLASGISNSLLMPIACRALFSRSPVADEGFILDALRFSKKTLSDLKKHNILVLDNSTDPFDMC